MCSGDKPLAAALELMNNEGVTSLPVLDNQNNVIGNISLADVRVSALCLISTQKLTVSSCSPSLHLSPFSAPRAFTS
jgi:predicted transcriptional regulator